MNRRAFLSLFGLSVVVTPALERDALAALPAAPAPSATPPVWALTGEWWVKDFDYNTLRSYAVAAVNRLTGEYRRQGILFDRPRTLRAERSTEALARRALRAWVDELNAGRLSGVPGHEVLEGREIRAVRT